MSLLYKSQLDVFLWCVVHFLKYSGNWVDLSSSFCYRILPLVLKIILLLFCPIKPFFVQVILGTVVWKMYALLQTLKKFPVPSSKPAHFPLKVVATSIRQTPTVGLSTSSSNEIDQTERQSRNTVRSYMFQSQWIIISGRQSRSLPNRGWPWRPAADMVTSLNDIFA